MSLPPAVPESIDGSASIDDLRTQLDVTLSGVPPFTFCGCGGDIEAGSCWDPTA
jgi:hypothetical protein